MAKSNETAAAPAKADKPAGPRFSVRTPNRTFTRVHTCGIRFVDGNGATNDERAARHCVECGYEVRDNKTGEVFNELPAPPKEEAEAADEKPAAGK